MARNDTFGSVVNDQAVDPGSARKNLSARAGLDPECEHSDRNAPPGKHASQPRLEAMTP